MDQNRIVADMSTEISAMERDADGFIVLNHALAKIARETLCDVATPARSLGVISKLGKEYAVVNVANPLADDYGASKHEISALSVQVDTVEYWRRQGYLA